MAAVADADDDHGVLIHCFAGKDRTGIVAALVLGVADVPDETIAADYAASAANMSGLFDEWVAGADDDGVRETRMRSALSPAETMEEVLGWVREAGGACGYLTDAGLTDDQLERLERRLVAD